MKQRDLEIIQIVMNLIVLACVIVMTGCQKYEPPVVGMSAAQWKAATEECERQGGEPVNITNMGAEILEVRCRATNRGGGWLRLEAEVPRVNQSPP